MTNLLSTAQMRAIEAAAMASGAVSGLELMERAGAGVVDAVMRAWPEFAATPHCAVVLCGPGNNGGDGFVIARLLAGQGWDVSCYLLGDAGKLPPDARVNHDRWDGIGTVHPLEDQDPAIFEGIDLVVDAVFGIGISRPLSEPLSKLLSKWRPAKWVAVDVPSGLCADSGKLVGRDVPLTGLADLTVTFEAPKWGHYLADGPIVCGALEVVPLDILNRGAGRRAIPEVVDVLSTGLNNVVGLQSGQSPKRSEEGRTDRHKYDRGHALVLSGGPGKTGAARLAARGALRVGAGLVTLGVPPSAQMEVACQVMSIMLARVPDAEALTGLLDDKRFNALCLGPGLGVSDATRTLVLAALDAKRATVLDADALAAFQHDPETLFARLHHGCVLTPHAGEFARLFPDLAEAWRDRSVIGEPGSKVTAVREAANRAGCTVLLKGADTVVAVPDGQTRIVAAVYGRAAPMLATAGSGDVLAGFITGLMAQGYAPSAAASRAAWLHQECGRMFGPGLIAEDLPEVLPRVLAAEQT
ncbi:NAD(P)H-hydrate dehydratase [Cognatishimia sp. MH4019]|uniref:NAD(P)H-hydrate dehydratase n=1 Tax=Cognatishimia sp. MH4019 TaxID=2854030 RepID=UPI001CD36DE9|nr:NAD(P)H-hydrate dehydratase [Cognatishimia sp. MH4019]